MAGAGTTRVFLGGPVGTLTLLPATLPLGVDGVADLDGDGRLDLLGLDASRQPARAASTASKAYHWQVLRPRAASTRRSADQLVRHRRRDRGALRPACAEAGRSRHRSCTSASARRPRADVVRIVWPNGVLQAEFDTPADQTVDGEQRLKGSCPWLFAWNGREMAFVTDLLWRSPLGLRINAQATADVLMTEDWVKVRGDQLAPRDGAYDLRITAELWETHFFDLVSLLVVDHPAGTEVFVDERFAVPPPTLRVDRDRSGAAVRVGHGRPRRRRRRDRRRARRLAIVDFAGRGAYQGITRAHFVEMELPDDGAARPARSGSSRQGWIHPTDSSINVAIGQGIARRAARARRCRSPTRRAASTTCARVSAFRPARTRRSSSISTGVFGPTRPAAPAARHEPRDLLGSAWRGRSDARTSRFDADAARARERGPLVSRLLGHRAARRRACPSGRATRSQAPRRAGAISRAIYTRFGDVRELLTDVDDRYVIMNAGDELRLRFPEAPRAGAAAWSATSSWSATAG